MDSDSFGSEQIQSAIQQRHLLQHPLVLIAGPCVIETEDDCCRLAEKIKDIACKTKIPFIFKASYDKANRTSIKSF